MQRKGETEMTFQEITEYIKKQDRTTVFVYAYSAKPERRVKPTKGVIYPPEGKEDIFDCNSLFVANKGLFEGKPETYRACSLSYELTREPAAIAYNEDILKQAENARKLYLDLINTTVPVTEEE